MFYLLLLLVLLHQLKVDLRCIHSFKLNKSKQTKCRCPIQASQKDGLYFQAGINSTVYAVSKVIRFIAIKAIGSTASDKKRACESKGPHQSDLNLNKIIVIIVPTIFTVTSYNLHKSNVLAH